MRYSSSKAFFFPFGALRYPLHRAIKLTLAGGNPSDNRYDTVRYDKPRHCLRAPHEPHVACGPRHKPNPLLLRVLPPISYHTAKQLFRSQLQPASPLQPDPPTRRVDPPVFLLWGTKLLGYYSSPTQAFHRSFFFTSLPPSQH